MKQDGVKERPQGFVACVLSEQFVQNDLVDIRKEAGYIELDDKWRREARQYGAEKLLGSLDGRVRTAPWQTGVAMGDEARDIVWFDKLFDNPLVNDAVVNGQCEDMSGFWIVNGELVVGRWQIGLCLQAFGYLMK